MSGYTDQFGFFRPTAFLGDSLLSLAQDFKKKGWSYRSAAKELGVSYQYLSDVLNGHYHSRRLILKVKALTERQHTQKAPLGNQGKPQKGASKKPNPTKPNTQEEK